MPSKSILLGASNWAKYVSEIAVSTSQFSTVSMPDFQLSFILTKVNELLRCSRKKLIQVGA